jgi:hypothetical protein
VHRELAGRRKCVCLGAPGVVAHGVEPCKAAQIRESGYSDGGDDSEKLWCMTCTLFSADHNLFGYDRDERDSECVLLVIVRMGVRAAGRYDGNGLLAYHGREKRQEVLIVLLGRIAR